MCLTVAFFIRKSAPACSAKHPVISNAEKERPENKISLAKSEKGIIKKIVAGECPKTKIEKKSL